jgi:hypothetical protein
MPTSHELEGVLKERGELDAEYFVFVKEAFDFSSC